MNSTVSEGLAGQEGEEPGLHHVEGWPPAPEPWGLTGPAETDPADPRAGRRAQWGGGRGPDLPGRRSVELCIGRRCSRPTLIVLPCRFTAEAQQRQRPYTYLPLRGGPRSCLVRLGLLEPADACSTSCASSGSEACPETQVSPAAAPGTGVPTAPQLPTPRAFHPPHLLPAQAASLFLPNAIPSPFPPSLIPSSEYRLVFPQTPKWPLRSPAHKASPIPSPTPGASSSRKPSLTTLPAIADCYFF